MRVFQFHSFYVPYLRGFYAARPEVAGLSYGQLLQQILDDRFYGTHVLAPVYEGSPDVAFSVVNDDLLQQKWANQHGCQDRSRVGILLAQIEEHKAEVVYSLDPVVYGRDFIRRLPGCVKKTVCWYASPLQAPEISAYDLRVSNFAKFLTAWTKDGLRCERFSPSLDPAMDVYATNVDRPVSVAFVGQYSVHHKTRNRLLEDLARRLGPGAVQYALQAPKWRPLLDVRFIHRIPTGMPYLPKVLRQCSTGPVYGVQMYRLFSRAKIVINAAVDVAGSERGNMRCFESMGCGAAMVSDSGIYPPDFVPGRDFSTYDTVGEAVQLVQDLLSDPARLSALAQRGREFMCAQYSKRGQWEQFCTLVSKL